MGASRIKKASKKGESQEADSFSLNKDEAAQIKALEQNVMRAKLSLADADVQVQRAEAARSEARAAVARAGEAYTQRLLAAMKDHGVDVSDSTAKWNFDSASSKFTKK